MNPGQTVFTEPFKKLGESLFYLFFKDVSYAQQGCIYFTKKTVIL